MKRRNQGFTLVELLIVIAIVAVLATVSTLIINPVELLKQSRDANRLTDLTSLKKVLTLLEGDQAGIALGSTSTVYVSLPDTSPICANLGLPSLPTGYTYRCVTQAALRQTDGTGWIPVNFNSFSGGVLLSRLPVDPSNNAGGGLYYTYIPGGSWEATSFLESERYRSQSAGDGDPHPNIYSVRSSASSLTPPVQESGLVGYWNFDNIAVIYSSNKSSSTDWSGRGNNGLVSTLSASNGNTLVSGKIGESIDFPPVVSNNSRITVSASSSINDLSSLTVSAWIYPRNKGQNNRGVLAGKTASTVSFPNITGGWIIQPHAPYNWIGFMAKFSGNSLIKSVAYPSFNQWHHLVITWDGTGDLSGLTIYIDGAIPATVSSQAGTGSYGGDMAVPLVIGNLYGTTGSQFDGIVDDMRLYNRVLTAAEVLSLYNASR